MFWKKWKIWASVKTKVVLFNFKLTGFQIVHWLAKISTIVLLLLEAPSSEFRFHISCHHLPYQDMTMIINIEIPTILLPIKVWFWWWLVILPMTMTVFFATFCFTVLASLRMPTGPSIICLRITAFYIPKETNKKVDCQNLRKLGEICWPSGYNFRANYCYFEKRNVTYCIFNGVTFDSYNIPNLSNLIIPSYFLLCEVFGKIAL